MKTVQEIYAAVDAIAPFSLALPWDNAGLQVGDFAAPVGRVLVALDATPQVLKEAAELGADLVLTHHPLLFDPIRQLVAPHPAFFAANMNIAVLAAHTNYDLAPDGVNTQLAKAIGLTGVEPLPGTGGDGVPVPGLVGNLPKEMSPQDFAEHLKAVLGITPRYNPLFLPIRRVALCGGSGADGLMAGLAAGCQALFTGEAKHHHFIQAQALGMTLFEGTHYATEALAMPALAARLQALCPDVTVTLAKAYDGGVMG